MGSMVDVKYKKYFTKDDLCIGLSRTTLESLLIIRSYSFDTLRSSWSDFPITSAKKRTTYESLHCSSNRSKEEGEEHYRVEKTSREDETNTCTYSNN